MGAARLAEGASQAPDHGVLCMKVPFNVPSLVGNELDYIRTAVVENRHLSGNGPYTKRCQKWLEERVACPLSLLTHSCTAALEMSALLAEVEPGDEVILPSFTFVSTANAFVLRGAVPVFVDIRRDTLNLDETQIEESITDRTRAVVVVHYAGVSCEMDPILDIAERRGLFVIEDAAHGLLATYKGRPLGSIGTVGTTSFHETKNVVAGEGGAIFVNDPGLEAKAEVLWEKGTDRSRFLRGAVDKYTWRDIGSSFYPGELTAAFLWAQLEAATELNAKRLSIWNRYHEALEDAEASGLLRRPTVPEHCVHNAHLYHVLLPDEISRRDVLSQLNARGVNAVFHFVPLHDSPAGRRFGRARGDLPVTASVAARIVRLPLWPEMEALHIDYVVDNLIAVVKKHRPT